MKNRTDYINELNSFLSSSKSCILKICEDLGWNNGNETMPQIQDEIVVCPLDSGHRMPKKSLPSHIEKCQLHKQGYSESSLMFPPSGEDGPNIVIIDEATLNAIIQPSSVNEHGNEAPIKKAVPLSCERLMTDFTRQERLAIYDYVVKNTNHCSKTDVKEINMTSQDLQDSKPMTLEELAAADRDAKRRRIRYKSKKVHTNRKSRTEVLRAVIQSQMDGYVEWIKQQNGESVQEDDEPASSEGQKSKPDCSNIAQETASPIKEIRHSWEQWDYFGLNPHKRYMNVLKEEADKKMKEDSRKFSEKHKSRTKDTSSSRYNEDTERNRRDLSSSDYKKYRYEDLHSKSKWNKYHIDHERYGVKSKEHRERDFNRFDSPRIKKEPHSSSRDNNKVGHGSDRKDTKYHSSSKFYKSENYDFDRDSPIHTKKHVEERMHSSSSKNNHSSINSHSGSDGESHHKSSSREFRHKSHKYKKKKHISKKRKRKRHSSTESSESD